MEVLLVLIICRNWTMVMTLIGDNSIYLTNYYCTFGYLNDLQMRPLTRLLHLYSRCGRTSVPPTFNSVCFLHVSTALVLDHIHGFMRLRGEVAQDFIKTDANPTVYFALCLHYEVFSLKLLWTVRGRSGILWVFAKKSGVYHNYYLTYLF